MPNPADARPCHSYPREGFEIYLDRGGVEIRVTEYHAKPLKLSWAQLEQLRSEARSAPAAGQT